MRFAFYIAAFSLLLQSLFLCSCGTFSKEPTPPPKKEIQFVAPDSREIPYQIGEEYTYTFKRLGEPIGEGKFIIVETKSGGFSLHSTIDIADDKNGDMMKGEGTLVLDRNWNPLKYRRTLDSKYIEDPGQNGVYTVEIVFENSTIKITHQEPDDEIAGETEIDNPGDLFVIDNNFIGQMAFMCSQPLLRSGRTENLKVFSVARLQIFDLTMTPKIKHEMEFAGERIVAYEVDMKVNDVTFGHYYVSQDGVMLEAIEEGGMTIIDLQPPQANS